MSSEEKGEYKSVRVRVSVTGRKGQLGKLWKHKKTNNKVIFCGKTQQIYKHAAKKSVELARQQRGTCLTSIDAILRNVRTSSRGEKWGGVDYLEARKSLKNTPRTHERHTHETPTRRDTPT